LNPAWKCARYLNTRIYMNSRFRATEEVRLFASTKTTAGSSPASKSDKALIVDKYYLKSFLSILFLSSLFRALTIVFRQFSREFQFLKIGSTKWFSRQSPFQLSKSLPWLQTARQLCEAFFLVHFSFNALFFNWLTKASRQCLNFQLTFEQPKTVQRINLTLLYTVVTQFFVVFGKIPKIMKKIVSFYSILSWKMT